MATHTKFLLKPEGFPGRDEWITVVHDSPYFDQLFDAYWDNRTIKVVMPGVHGFFRVSDLEIAD